MFINNDMLLTLFLGHKFEKYFKEIYTESKKNKRLLQLARLNIVSGTKAILVNDEKDTYACILEPETTFYVTKISKEKVLGKYITVIDFDLTFSTKEETYQKFKNHKNITIEDLHTYEEMD